MTDNNNTTQTNNSNANTNTNNTNTNNNSSDPNAIPPAIAELDKKHLDIEGILEKIKNLPIDDEDKATILEQFKDNILNPGKSENKNLDQIQAKYATMDNANQLPPMEFLPPVNANYPYGYYQQQMPMQQMPMQQIPMQIPMQQIPMQIPMQQIPFQMPPQQMPMQQMIPQQGNQMTTVHFEILKNKLDSLQLELIDLLRHVKDYTQRYMNAVRGQDLDKINDYINGLFQVDKTLKETKEKTEEALVEPEENAETREGIISKTTNGIKNFLGGLGNNVSGISKLVASTADIANGYLSKKILPTSNASTSNVTTSSNSTGKTNTNVSRNKNIVSVDEYISDMNNLEGKSNNNSNIPIPKSNIITINSDKLNSNSNTTKNENNNTNSNTNNSNNNNSNTNTNNTNNTNTNNTNNTNTNNTNTNNTNTNNTNTNTKNKGFKATEAPSTDDDLNSALENLNDKINKDNEPNETNTNQQGGSSHKDKLTKKISLLRLKLTKKRLQKQLKEEKNNKTIHNHKAKYIHSRSTKHKNVKSKLNTN